MAVVFFVDGIKWAKYIPIGLFCKDVPFEVSATKIYLDDIAKELPGLCYAVPHELLMDEEIFSKILYIADPGEVYNELLTDEEKLDKGIVCRLLKELKYSDFRYFKEGFCNLCDNVSRDILMDKEVRELFFRSGIPSLIYEEILTEKGFLIFCRSG